MLSSDGLKINRIFSDLEGALGVIAVGSMSNLMSGVLQVLFPSWAHSFTIVVKLLVKNEH